MPNKTIDSDSSLKEQSEITDNIERHLVEYETFKNACVLAGRDIEDVPTLWLAYRVEAIELAIFTM